MRGYKAENIIFPRSIADLSSVKAPTVEVLEIAEAVRAEAEQKISRTFAEFVPLSYKTQVNVHMRKIYSFVSKENFQCYIPYIRK